MWVIAHLPRVVREGLGRLVGLALYHFARRRTHIVRVNLTMCFPYLSASEREALVKQCCLEHGYGVIDTALSWFGPVSMCPRLDVHDLEVFDQALAKGRGVLMIGAHFTAIDICSRMFAETHPLSAMYRPLKNPVMHWGMDRAMRRFEQAIHRDDMRSLVRRLKSGGVVWYAPDQDYGPKHSVFAPFFGVPAASVVATARIVKMTGCEVVVASQWRRDHGRRLEMTFTQLDGDWPTGDDVRDCATVNAAIEKNIALEPAQYMWTHRRFKTRPEGESRPY